MREQRKAAYVGEYAASNFLLGAPELSAVKDAKNAGVLEDLTAILQVTRPEVVYTHNLADKQ